MKIIGPGLLSVFSLYPRFVNNKNEDENENNKNKKDFI